MARTHLELNPIYQAHQRNIKIHHDKFREFAFKFNACKNMIRRRYEAHKKWIHYNDKLQKIRPATDKRNVAKVPRVSKM